MQYTRCPDLRWHAHIPLLFILLYSGTHIHQWSLPYTPLQHLNSPIVWWGVTSESPLLVFKGTVSVSVHSRPRYTPPPNSYRTFTLRPNTSSHYASDLLFPPCPTTPFLDNEELAEVDPLYFWVEGTDSSLGSIPPFFLWGDTSENMEATCRPHWASFLADPWLQVNNIVLFYLLFSGNKQE